MFWHPSVPDAQRVTRVFGIGCKDGIGWFYSTFVLANHQENRLPLRITKRTTESFALVGPKFPLVFDKMDMQVLP